MATAEVKKSIIISNREFPLHKTTREIQKDFTISNILFPFRKTKGLPKMEKLYETLVEYYNVVNPFANSSLKLKEINEYPADMQIRFEAETSLELLHKCVSAHFLQHKNGWFYESCFPFQKNRKKGWVSIGCLFHNGNDDKQPLDQIVYIDHFLKKNDETIVDLRISLKTGLAWETYHEEQATRVTDEQIETMIAYLKISIRKIKKNIVNYMICDS